MKGCPDHVHSDDAYATAGVVVSKVTCATVDLGQDDQQWQQLPEPIACSTVGHGSAIYREPPDAHSQVVYTPCSLSVRDCASIAAFHTSELVACIKKADVQLWCYSTVTVVPTVGTNMHHATYAMHSTCWPQCKLDMAHDGI